ncbi:hypothetical protein UFOVP1_4 [uncultured Caudovirales phage]|uniref:Uncharacterized protein n=1 Tax=uncultured Caudovirales phage TaxID=2100421 RepID=A0A6J5KKX0_9CAUD|nr:hypothetical protein UFOVP1_4 [uncultured Caudovirales phage]
MLTLLCCVAVAVGMYVFNVQVASVVAKVKNLIVKPKNPPAA